jgi:hypothetical protein
MKNMQKRLKYLSIALFIGLISGGLAEAQQTKFWAMDLGNYWDYIESPSDTWFLRLHATTLDTTTFPIPTYLMAGADYQNSTWAPMENWWYEIRETGPNASELRVWKIMGYDDVDRAWLTFVFDSGIIWAKRPMTVGDSWISNASGTHSDGTNTFPINITVNSGVLAYESVDVPFGNGTYRAYKISHFIQIPGVAQTTQTLWVVPYLGIIKHESVDADGTDRDSLSAMDIATVFNDAPYDHWAYPYIMKIYDAGYTTGCGDGFYCPEGEPDGFVSREQMAVFITRALGQVPAGESCETPSPFTDVPDDWWSCKYVQKLYNLGFAGGYGDGRFGPADRVTREQMAVFITRALGQVPAGESCETPSPFTDVPDDWWSCKYVQELYQLGIAGGYGDGRYGPGDEVTRAQMAVFLSRAFLD